MFPVGVQLGFFTKDGLVSLGENKVVISCAPPLGGSVVGQRVVLCGPSVECHGDKRLTRALLAFLIYGQT